ncbi:SMI1/KNR4 family protein [Paenibacillus oralis]|uniref:SMI1/KNR4 family protein n=1 Tax=Paenibacillus oralis TaxID=2490856 RepID=A0A3P3TVQ4_9BACL|nr:SMI1/KNR4 family protein [Paenibacillus oralis]RRJ61834.1 SMI1/KNR4 family protein [Paenibacillus oralis]
MLKQAERLWSLIIGKGAAKDTGFQEALRLRPGAGEAEFEHAEKALGLKLPEEMKAFYQVHNGQDWDLGSEPFVRNLTLSPLEEIVENWNFLREEFEADEMEPDIGQEIKPLLWNDKWIPIASNGGGDYLCLDMDPAEAGQVGQVLYFWHDWGNRSVEAASLFSFIQICLDEEDE